MESLSKSIQEVRDQDEARIQKDRELLADLRPILGSPGMSRMLQILREDWGTFEKVASASYDSVLHPAPIQAQAVKQYIMSLIDKIEGFKKMDGIPGE